MGVVAVLRVMVLVAVVSKVMMVVGLVPSAGVVRVCGSC